MPKSIERIKKVAPKSNGPVNNGTTYTACGLYQDILAASNTQHVRPGLSVFFSMVFFKCGENIGSPRKHRYITFYIQQRPIIKLAKAATKLWKFRTRKEKNWNVTLQRWQQCSNEDEGFTSDTFWQTVKTYKMETDTSLTTGCIIEGAVPRQTEKTSKQLKVLLETPQKKAITLPDCSGAKGTQQWWRYMSAAENKMVKSNVQIISKRRKSKVH